MRWLIFISLLAVATTAACYQPARLRQEAVIEQQGSRLCFKIADSEDSRLHHPSIRYVSIGERLPGEHVDLWKASFLEDGLKEPVVSPEQCIPYEKVGPAPNLKANKAYYLNIVGDSVNERGEPEIRRYNAKFCLLSKNNTVTVRQTYFDKKRGRWDWTDCNLPEVAP